MPRLPSTTSASDVVQRAEDARALGVVRVGELFAFALVAAAAVLGRDDRGDPLAFVLEGVRLAFLGQRGTRSSRRSPGSACWRPTAGRSPRSPSCGTRRRPWSPATFRADPRSGPGRGAAGARAATRKAASSGQQFRWIVYGGLMALSLPLYVVPEVAVISHTVRR